MDATRALTLWQGQAPDTPKPFSLAGESGSCHAVSLTQRQQRLPEFHPQTVLRDWGNGEGFRLSDALTGVCVFGATGSGKTSGPAKHLAYGYLAAGFGGLVLCAKKEERRQWEQWAAETDRTDDLVIIDASGGNRFNFLDWEASRPGEGGGLSINIVNLIDEIATAISGKGDGKGGDNKFWEDSLHHMNTNLVELPLLAGLDVTLPLLRSILTSAAISREQVNDPQWQKNSTCWAMIAEADKMTLKGDPKARADFEECRNYWQQEFPDLHEKTRSLIVLTFSMLVKPLLTRPLREIFSADTNIKPEDTFEGKIIIVDIPVQEYRLVGRIANLAWKYCFQVAVLRRMQPADRQSFLRPVFLWADEAQNFVTKFDAEYQAVARSAGGCTVYLTQNLSSYIRVLDSYPAVESLLGNLQCKFFCQNSGDTNEWAARLLGQRWVMKTGTSAGHQTNEPSPKNPEEQRSHNSGVNRKEEQRLFVEPATFTTLKRGGEMHNFQVEAIVYNGGNLFYEGNLALPFRLLTFNQR